jgi:hypothetical protein
VRDDSPARSRDATLDTVTGDALVKTEWKSGAEWADDVEMGGDDDDAQQVETASGGLDTIRGMPLGTSNQMTGSAHIQMTVINRRVLTIQRRGGCRPPTAEAELDNEDITRTAEGLHLPPPPPQVSATCTKKT